MSLDAGPEHRRPRWVTVTVVVAAVLLVLLAVLWAVGGGSHGPGRHMSSAETSDALPVGGAAAATGA